MDYEYIEYIAEGEYIELTAEDYWKKNKDKVTAWISYATALEKDGHIEEAASTFEQALDSKVLTKKIRLAEQFGKFVVKHYDFKAGSEAFKKLFSITSTNHLNDAYFSFLTKHEQYETAERLLAQQASIVDTNKIWFRLAEVYEAKKRYNKAIPIYESLTERNPSNGQAWKKLRNAEKAILAFSDDKEKIIKSISFPQEYHSAGLSILQNFGTVLNQKYPDGGVAFSISQNGLKVTMVIEHPEGDKEIIEDYLNRYGLVVTGAIKPEQYSQNPLEVMELKRQLIQFESDLTWANEKQRMLEGIVKQQDNDISYFKGQIERVLLENERLSLKQTEYSDALIHRLGESDRHIEHLVSKLISGAENSDTTEVQKVIDEISQIKPTAIDKVREFAFITMSSAGGNAPAWIEFLTKTLP